MDADLADQTELTIPSETYSAPDQPYPGLRPFRENEQRLFFGRDRQIKEILQRLERSSFAVVIGGSGSGKSSIVNAGVIPSLRKKQLRGRGDFWLTARFSPLDRPLESLAGALAELIEPKPGQTRPDIIAEIQQTLLETNSIAGFLDRYRNHLKLEEGQAPESRENANLLIVCDQFEEIFRDQNRENPETRQLVDLIVEAFRNRDEYPQLYVMIGMRSEDLHRCALYIDLPNVINQASFLTRRLDDDEIASAIIEPMRLVLRLRGIRPARFKPIEVDPWPFDVELLRRLYKAVSSLSYNPDHLPLLQHLLSVLWRHVEAKYVLDGDKTGNGTAAASITITPDDLAAALGFSSIDEVDAHARRNKLPDSWILERALDQAAEGVMPRQDRLRRITEIMFRLLAQVDDQGIYSRRWTTRQEIADVAGTQIVAKPKGFRGLWQRLSGRARVADDDRPATDAEIEEVISAFTSTYPFLHVLDGREGNIDVSHEAFIRNWKTFRNWLQDERILASGFGAVRAAYERWLAKARDPHRRWFVGLRAMFGARLRSEELYEVRGWWNERRNSLPWAQRYAQGAHSEDADSRTAATSADRGRRKAGWVARLVARMAARHWKSQAMRRRNREPGAAIQPASTKPDRRKRAPAAAPISPAKFCGDLFHRRVALCDGAVDFHCRRLGRGVENPGCVVRYAAGGVQALPHRRHGPCLAREGPRQSGKRRRKHQGRDLPDRDGAGDSSEPTADGLDGLVGRAFFERSGPRRHLFRRKRDAPTRQRALPWDSPSGRSRLLRPCCRRRQAGRPRIRRA